MANNHEQFIEFNGVIRLTNARRKGLKGSRKELRRKIRKYFDEEKSNEIKPKFSGQGSLLMDTIVNPIPRAEGEKTVLYYDVDDGVYFIGNESQSERKSIQTYHQWIYDAVKNHTDQDPIRKNTCVRVLFADGHNIDLPIYYKQGNVPELAHKAKGWIKSDPKEFADWFNKKADQNDQLRRIVRYLKAWKDFREFSDTSRSFPSGLILTILAANNFYSHDRDDVALKETLVLIENALTVSFECRRPTTPVGENLLAEYSQQDYFMGALRQFISSAKKAINEGNLKKGCEYWQKELGDRFSCSNAPDETEKEKSPELKSIVGNHKPYGSISGI